MMNRKATFADSFWETDFQSSAGYDALKKVVKEGKQSCMAFEQFLRLRAKAEEEYGKSLQKACKLLIETQNAGTLRTAWEKLKEETDETAVVHMETSGQWSDAAIRLNNFVKRQKNERTIKDAAVCASSKEKISLYRKTLDLKKQYDTKCQEAEQVELHHNRAKQNENSMPTREWDKIVLKNAKSKQDAYKADSNYQESLTRLEQARQQWENDMTTFCTLCESLEEARIRFMQNEMWLCCNIISIKCVEEDKCYELVRSVLERVNVESDIQSYITKARTGSERPTPIKFEPYPMQRVGSDINATLGRHSITQPFTGVAATSNVSGK